MTFNKFTFKNHLKNAKFPSYEPMPKSYRNNA